MAIAILGGGVLGCCTALELADRGHEVVIFERNQQAMSEASLYNEGKLHLGYVYAADRSFRTAARMIDGAVRFLDTLQRWVPAAELSAIKSTPFDYVVHRDSMVAVQEVEAHFTKVQQHFADRSSRAARLLPADSGRPAWRRLSDQEIEYRYNPDLIVAAYETNEIAVDTWRIATLLRDAIDAHPGIEVRLGCEVSGVGRSGDGGFDIAFRYGVATGTDSFDAVVNALWANRPFIDDQLGIMPEGRWYIRRKLGVNILPDTTIDVPSFTVMLGPFGDVVRYGSGRIYLSWYPDCMIGTSTTSEPTDWGKMLVDVDMARVRSRTLAARATLCPALQVLEPLNGPRAVVNGGSIFAMGESDIDDPLSRLHERLAYGNANIRGYASVDTSKYTLGPATAIDTADRIEQQIGSAAAR